MNFVELRRFFVPIKKDQEPMLNIGSWGHKIGGWLDWSELRRHRRVVLLAEALSGKTEEFRNQQRTLSAQGKPAFFIRIEELADEGFEAALEPSSAETFATWRSSTEQAYFFLDSVDEARLVRKSFETALKKFARELGRAVERAYVFVSCRVTDWKIREDRMLVEAVLPWRDTPEESQKDADPLLDPIFNEKEKNQAHQTEVPKAKVGELLVVQLVPLSDDQCRPLAREIAVADPDVFMEAIQQSGLDAFTERPGDVIDLAAYWKAHGHFSELAEMFEYNISRKLTEADAYRPDNNVLPPDKAREGAERVAAALTLGKSFTLTSPGHDPDPNLAAGALDPSLILKEWSDAERNALLRRGIFAPSTYGRIRFHHRTTQEYLVAQWLNRRLNSNCPREHVWNLIFAERYGVETLVPSLRPAAAWLASCHLDIRDEVLRREPLVLIRHGDPSSLPLNVKKQLLLAYARKHADADIADDSLEHRALWLFSEAGLAKAIRQAWSLNTRPDFRIDLLRIVREGPIPECADLARKSALDECAGDVLRIIAVEALVKCGDTTSLNAVSRQVVRSRTKLTPRLASEISKALFPKYLSTNQLLRIIDSQPETRGAGGFPYALTELYEQSGDAQTRKAFVVGLVKLCLKKPFVDTTRRVSKRHLELAEHLAPIARQEVQRLRGRETPAHLVRLLMAVERSGGDSSSEDGLSLSQLVQQNRDLRRALFWADVAEVRENRKKGDKELIRIWQIAISCSHLWTFGINELQGLFDELSHRRHEDDRRVVLSAIVSILRHEGRLDSELPRIQQLIAGQPTLQADLDEYMAPPIEDEHDRNHREWMQEIKKKRAVEQETAKASWQRFGDYVRQHSNELSCPKMLASWKTGAFRLYQMTEWLRHRTGRDSVNCPLQWRLLEEGFGHNVAEAYRDGMKALWRVTKPERPLRKEGGTFTVKHTTVLAVQGLALEAAEDPEWTSYLTNGEIKTAALHGCLSEQGYPSWLDSLIVSHPDILVPIIKRTIKQEWEAKSIGRTDFLNQFALPDANVLALQSALFDVISGHEPDDVSKLDGGLRILARLELSEVMKRQLARNARARLRAYADARQTDRALRSLALLLIVDGDRAIDDFSQWLAKPKRQERQTRAEMAFAYIFDRHDQLVPAMLGETSTEKVEQLLRLAYHYVHPQQDQRHEGCYTSNTRDHAESARNTILSAILHRPGFEAYDALRRIACDPKFALRKERFSELAREKAERDSELLPWKEKEVVAFEEMHAAPIKTGADLLRVVISVLRDIQFDLDNGDVSSRPLLLQAKNEDEVRNWVVEQMKLRARGQFHAYREAQVANKDRPDIIIASTAAHCEVGMEVKHGGKKWTRTQLENALLVQLANDYLKPASRRQGVFVVTNHGLRRWRNAETKKLMDFSKLMNGLGAIAAKITKNDSGLIQVCCAGIDATEKNG